MLPSQSNFTKTRNVKALVERQADDAQHYSSSGTRN